MATAKRDLTDTQVQGPPLNQRDARLDTTRGDATESLRDRNISHNESDLHVSLNQAEIEAAPSRDRGSANGKMAKAAQELVRRTRAEQGLPPRIEDPTVIARIIALLQPVIDD